MSMSRQECEKRLLEKCEEMNDILKEYDPKADYLSVCIDPKAEYISINNDYWAGHPMILCSNLEELEDE